MEKRKIIYEPLQSKTVMNKVTAPSMPFAWSINPYRGCQHGCSFCYARSTHSFLGIPADDTFQNHIFMKSNAPEALEEQLRKAARSAKGLAGLGTIAIGTATDPYQQIEGKAQITRQCLAILARYQVPVAITTRSPLVSRDIDLLKNIPGASVNISLNTLNNEVWRNMEPSTPSPAKRLETVRRLSDEGISAGLFMAPILPLLTDSAEQFTAIIEAAAEHGARFVMPSFLRLNTNDVKVWFFQTIERHYPHMLESYAKLYQAGAYLPDKYRAPKKELINRLLDQYGFNRKEPFLIKEKGLPSAEATEDAPVQLSFMF